MGISRKTFALAQSGEPEAVESVFAWVTPIVRKVVYQRWYSDTNHILAAEDVVQDILTEIHLRLPRATYHGKAELGAWVKRIAWTRCISAHRVVARRKRLRTGGQFGEASHVDRDVRSQSSLVQAREQIRQALLHLDDLAATCRFVVVSRFFGHRSNAEVAELIGKSTAATSMILKRGLQRLRSLMK